MKDSKNNYLIEKAPIKKTIALLVIPALLGSIVGQINFILDTFFLSRVGYTDINVLLTAVAAAFPISLIIVAFANLFAIGGSIVGAKILGTGDKLKARGIFSGTVVSALILNVVLILLLLIFIKPLLTFLGANDSQSLSYAMDYAVTMIIGSPTVILTLIFVMFARSEGKAFLVLFSIVFQTLLNIILNYFFIIPLEMATFGASLATVISQFSQFLIVGAFLFSKKSFFEFTFKFRKLFKYENLKNIIKLGFPATLTIGLLTVSSGILQFQAGSYNDPALVGAIGVLVKFFTMFTMLIQAAASGIQPVFAYSFGANNRERFILTARSYLKISLIISGIIGIIIVIYPSIFANFLSLNGDIGNYITIGSYGLGIMLIFMSGSFLLQVLFQSLGEAQASMMIVLIRQLLIFMVLTIVLNKTIGIEGILLSQQIAIVLGSILTIVLYYGHFMDILNKKFMKK